MCPHCEGMGAVNDFDLTQVFDDSKSLNEGAITVPGYSIEGWYGRIFRDSRVLRPEQADQKYTKEELRTSSTRRPTKVKIAGINMTYAG